MQFQAMKRKTASYDLSALIQRENPESEVHWHIRPYHMLKRSLKE
jgi:hypothetical protein